MNKKLPAKCPSCENLLKVRQMYCEECGTEVNGQYDMPLLSRLDNVNQKFILDFIKSSGSLKVMAQNMKLSYPTVRNRLDEIIDKVLNLENN